MFKKYVIFIILLIAFGCATDKNTKTSSKDEAPVSNQVIETRSYELDLSQSKETKASATSEMFSIQDKRIRKILMDADKIIWGKFGMQNNYKYNGFNEPSYKKLMYAGKSLPYKEIQELYPKVSRISFTAYDKTFLFCGYIEDQQIAFCDDASCDGVEEFEKSNTSDLLNSLRSNISTPGKCQ